MGACSVSVRSPSVTSTKTVPEKSSPHVYVIADWEDHSVSHVPSPLKSQRYWRESPSGSEDPDASIDRCSLGDRTRNGQRGRRRAVDDGRVLRASLKRPLLRRRRGDGRNIGGARGQI